MGRLRFSIAGLLGLVAFCGVAVAALRTASELWDSTLLGVTLLILTGAVLRAVHSRGPTRGFWLGFALFGGVYLGATLIPPVSARLPTTTGLRRLDAMRPEPVVGAVFSDFDADGVGDLIVVEERTAPGVGAPPGPGNVMVSRRWAPSSGMRGPGAPGTGGSPLLLGKTATWTILPRRRGTSEQFLGIGHSLLALVFGVIGGLASRRMAARAGSTTAGA